MTEQAIRLLSLRTCRNSNTNKKEFPFKLLSCMCPFPGFKHFVYKNDVPPFSLFNDRAFERILFSYILNTPHPLCSCIFTSTGIPTASVGTKKQNKKRRRHIIPVSDSGAAIPASIKKKKRVMNIIRALNNPSSSFLSISSFSRTTKVSCQKIWKKKNKRIYRRHKSVEWNRDSYLWAATGCCCCSIAHI